MAAGIDQYLRADNLHRSQLPKILLLDQIYDQLSHLLCLQNAEGMEPDDLLCSRNARPQRDGKGSLAVLLLAERARSECARSTRAIEDRPDCPSKYKGGVEELRAVNGSLGHSPK